MQKINILYRNQRRSQKLIRAMELQINTVHNKVIFIETIYNFSLESDDEYGDEVFENVDEELVEDLEEDDPKNKDRKVLFIQYNGV